MGLFFLLDSLILIGLKANTYFIILHWEGENAYIYYTSQQS